MKPIKQSATWGCFYRPEITAEQYVAEMKEVG